MLDLLVSYGCSLPLVVRVCLLVEVQDSGDRPVSTHDTGISLKKHMRLEDDQYSHPPDHIMGTSPGEVDHDVQGGLRSNNAYVLQTIGNANIWVVPRISRSSPMA
jgi:hypothetical protein